DPVLEKILIESIISGFKPLEECTEKELESKESGKKRNARIMARLKEALSDKVYEKINRAGHVLDFFNVRTGK
nr:hypothetical protein [Candidatus Dependentiae bacterium]